MTPVLGTRWCISISSRHTQQVLHEACCRVCCLQAVYGHRSVHDNICSH